MKTSSDDLQAFLSDLPINVEGLIDEDLQSALVACEELTSHFSRLSSVLALAMQARISRRAGLVAAALATESALDRIAKRLPDFMKW
jgi:p-aminobenzoyl-glutamate transporter AbgT